MSKVDVLAGVVGFQIGVIIGLALVVSRVREKVARLEEWARLYEKQMNGK